MKRVYYNSNPDRQYNNHIGRNCLLTEQSYKDFEDVDIDEAIFFWLECCSPISKLDDIVDKKWAKQLGINYEEIKNTVMQEEYLDNQKMMYAMTLSEDEFFENYNLQKR